MACVTFKGLVIIYSSLYFILYSTEEIHTGLELHDGE